MPAGSKKFSINCSIALVWLTSSVCPTALSENPAAVSNAGRISLILVNQ